MVNMHNKLTNIDRVKKIKEILFLNSQAADSQLADFINTQAIIKSPANFSNLTGISGLRAALSYWKKAFTYSRSSWISVENTDNTVTVQWEAECVHTGDDFFGVKAEEQPLSYGGTTTYEFIDGKLVSYRVDVDIEAIKQQLQLNLQQNLTLC